MAGRYTVGVTSGRASQGPAAAVVGGVAGPSRGAGAGAGGGEAPWVWAGRDLLGLADVPVVGLRAMLRETARWAEVATDPATRADELAGGLSGRAVAMLFFEDSTRTRTSFALAARRLGAEVVEFSASSSSVNKGESLVDTALTVEAMGVSAMVVRARQAGAAALVAGAVGCPVINAGDGRHEHPTQGLLDAFTIARRMGRLESLDLSGITVGIVGDVGSSRVARSNIACLTALGARVVCVGPVGLAPAGLSRLGRGGEGSCRVSHDLDAELGAMDVVMMLRVQFERHGDGAGKGVDGTVRSSPAVASAREYRAGYGLTAERAGRLKPGAIVMHPGPMNRGLEIDSVVADGARSVVLEQVSAGVAARMACLGLLVGCSAG